MRRAEVITYMGRPLDCSHSKPSGCGLGETILSFRKASSSARPRSFTFGGAYAVLPYVTQQALFHYGWLRPGQMMDGLGLAETTARPSWCCSSSASWADGSIRRVFRPSPRPLLEPSSPRGSPSRPCFLWIFLGGPYIEKLRGNSRLSSPFPPSPPAVVGVVLNLAVWFALNALFPNHGQLDWFALGLTLVALIGMLRWKWDVIPVVLGAGLIGLIYRTLL